MRLTIGILLSIILLFITILLDAKEISLPYLVGSVVVIPIPAMIGAYMQGCYEAEKQKGK